ncbi:acetate--CoA ligase family protein [Actinomadura physcomitrii]|uniref:acetate--CoA ligase family protein n=1 Tax=Actinomadura physcomitrii TaxID=2650748 RepID=UPI0013702B40|nr:acetate--CoA ligase family protein [Actinomadura physcomitrii]
MTADLDPFFFPRRIGLLGYSSNPARWGNRLLDTVARGGFEGEIVAVRPRIRPEGLASVDRLDERPLDLLVIAIPAEQVPDAVAEAREAGVRAVLIISAGFAEVGAAGRDLQRRVVEAAGDMPVMGPNCLGIVSGPASLRLSVNSHLSARTRPVAGPVAVLSQSGAVGHVLAGELDARGVGWSFYVSTGNEAVLGLGELGAYLLRRPEVRTLVLYVESLHDVEGYRRLGRIAAALGKAVVVLKTGISESSQRAALSHTAAVAGDFLLFEGLSGAEGITVVRDEEELVEAAYAAFAPAVLPERTRLGVVTVSGGIGALIADQVAGAGGVVPALGEGTQGLLREVYAGLASTANPVDLSGTFPVEAGSISALLDVLDAAPEVDAIIFGFAHGEQYLETFGKVLEHLGTLRKPAWFVWSGGAVTGLETAGPTGRLFDGVPRFARMFRTLPRRRAAIGSSPLPEGPTAPLLDAVSEARRRDVTVLTERIVSPLLAGLGIPSPRMAWAESPDALGAAVSEEALPGPWVLKVDDPGLPHRAKLGLVKLGLATAEELRAAAEEMARVCRTLDDPPSAPAFVVQHQEQGVAEFSVGAVRDPVFGPMIVVGPGGGAVEGDGERAASPVPLTPRGVADLHRAAESNAGAPVDPAAFAAIVEGVAAVLRIEEVAELDLNPVMVVGGGGLVAVDSLLVIA